MSGTCKIEKDSAFMCEDHSAVTYGKPTLENAKELTIKKWECLIESVEAGNDYEIELGDDFTVRKLLILQNPDLYLELRGYRALCPLCSLYLYNCGDCPLGDKYGACDESHTPYSGFLDLRLSPELRISKAQEILDIIKAWVIPKEAE
jgi:hypothetical protein